MSDDKKVLSENEFNKLPILRPAVPSLYLKGENNNFNECVVNGEPMALKDMPKAFKMQIDKDIKESIKYFKDKEEAIKIKVEAGLDPYKDSNINKCGHYEPFNQRKKDVFADGFGVVFVKEDASHCDRDEFYGCTLQEYEEDEKKYFKQLKKRSKK